jgi:hypothetical protein
VDFKINDFIRIKSGLHCGWTGTITEVKSTNHLIASQSTHLDDVEYTKVKIAVQLQNGRYLQNFAPCDLELVDYEREGI